MTLQQILAQLSTDIQALTTAANGLAGNIAASNTAQNAAIVTQLQSLDTAVQAATAAITAAAPAPAAPAAPAA